MTDMASVPVYMNTDDWITLISEAEDGRKRLIETEREYEVTHPRIATAARIEATRIGVVLERLRAQVTVPR